LHHALHVRVAPAGVDPQFHVVEPLDFAVEGLDHELHLLMVLAVGVGHKVERRLLGLDRAAAASRSACSSLFIASAMSQTTWRLSLYLGVWMSRKSAITCEQQVPNL